MVNLKGLLGVGLLGLLTGCETSEIRIQRGEFVRPTIQLEEKAEVADGCFLGEKYPELTEELMDDLAMIVYLEGEHTFESDSSVANVIKNRYNFDKEHNSRKFGKSLKGIIEKPYAFESYTKRPECFDIKEVCIEDEKAWDLAYDTMTKVLLGEIPDSTKGAVSFKTQSKNDLVWNNQELFWLDGVRYVTKHTTDIGNQRYYAAVQDS